MPADAHSGPKLPAKQLAILAVARFAEPLAYTSVFPYLPEMIRDFGVEQDEIAKWAGATSAVFSIAQSITAVPWGKAADYYGRKPVLIWGLLATMICFVVWGVSTSLAMAITVRAIQGASNGNVGIIRTMVAELVPEKELQPRAFSIMPLVWSLGSVIGPSFGGFFAQPAKQFPSVFGGIEFFKRYPYSLPNLIAMLFFLVSVATAAMFLQETLASKRTNKDWGLLVGRRLTRAFKRRPMVSHRRSSFVDGEATAPLVPSKLRPKDANHVTHSSGSPGMKEVFTYQTSINLLAYSFLAFHSVAYDQNIPVLLNYPLVERTPENTKLPFYFTGGFGMSSGTIGTMFTLYGISCGVIQFLLYPPAVAKFGLLGCLKFCTILMPTVYLITPFIALLPTYWTRFIGVFLIMMLKGVGGVLAFPSTTILLTNSCASLRVLGTLNGFATMFSGIGRALGPATTGLVFTWGAEHGYMVSAYWFMALFAAIGAIPVYMIREGDGPTAFADNSDSEDSDNMADSGVILPDEDAIEDSSDDDDDSTPNGDEELSPTTPLLKTPAKDYFTINK